MTDLPGTSTTSAVITIGQSLSSTLDSPSDVDWIRIQNGAYGTASYSSRPYFQLASDADLSGAGLAVYAFNTSFNQWQRYYVPFDLADIELPRLVSLSGNATTFVALTGFSGDYTLSLGDGAGFFAGHPDDFTTDVTLTPGTTVSGTTNHALDEEYFIYQSAVAGNFYRITVTPGEGWQDTDGISLSVRGSQAVLRPVQEGDDTVFEGVFQFNPFNSFSTYFNVVVSAYDRAGILQSYAGLDYTVTLEDLGTGAGLANATQGTASVLPVGQTTNAPIVAFNAEHWFSFAGQAGHGYLIQVDNRPGYGQSTQIVAGTALTGAGNQFVQDTRTWQGREFSLGTVGALSGDTTVSFALRDVQGFALAQDDTVSIRIIEYTDAVASDVATVIGLDTPLTESFHYGDADLFGLMVEAGEFYEITMTYDPGSLARSPYISFGVADQWAYDSSWETRYDRETGTITQRFVALQDGLAQFQIGGASSFRRDGITYWPTPEDMDFTYTVTASVGFTDDRGNVQGAFGSPLALDEVATAFVNLSRDVDGYVFDVVAGQTYTVTVSGGAPNIDLNTDRNGDDRLVYYVNEYPTPPDYSSWGPTFADQAALLAAGPGLGLTLTRDAMQATLRFTADYTGRAGVNVYVSGQEMETYSVHATAGETPDAVLQQMGLPSGLADVLAGTTDNDAITGRGGNDTIWGGDGNDTINGGTGRDMLEGGAGDDMLIGGGGADTLDGADGDDSIDAGGAADLVYGGAGHDSIDAGNGSDTVHGEGGADTLILRGGADLAYGGIGADTINGMAGLDTLYGNAGDDAINGGGQDDQLYGGIGSDTLNGGNGFDHLDGGDGNDRLLGGVRADTLLGGTGDDTLRGDDGNDVLEGGSGNDRLIGGGQVDTFVFADGFGQDTITDFDAADRREKIDLSGVSAITNWADLVNNHMTQAGPRVIIDDGAGNTIRLDGVNLADLDPSDFVF